MVATRRGCREGGEQGLDRLQIAFDDERAVANAGLVLASTLATRLGIEQVVDETLDLGQRTGAARPGRKLLTLVASALVGGDSIDDADVLRCGETERAWPSHAGALDAGDVPAFVHLRAACERRSASCWLLPTRLRAAIEL